MFGSYPLCWPAINVFGLNTPIPERHQAFIEHVNPDVTAVVAYKKSG